MQRRDKFIVVNLFTVDLWIIKFSVSYTHSLTTLINTLLCWYCRVISVRTKKLWLMCAELAAVGVDYNITLLQILF